MNIDLITCSEVKDIEGDPGNFEVTLVNRPRYIDPVKCTGCGECARHCPVTAVNQYNMRLDDRRATYIEYAQAVPLAFAIDTDTCIGCGLCENMCIAKAVEYDDKERETKVRVGSVILSTGSRGYDPSQLDYLGVRQIPQRGDQRGVRTYPERLGPLLRSSDAAARPRTAQERSPGSSASDRAIPTSAATGIARRSAACTPSKRR